MNNGIKLPTIGNNNNSRWFLYEKINSKADIGKEIF